MGIQWLLSVLLTINMMKSIVFAALVAAVYAEADADAGLLYGGLGYSSLGYARTAYAAPAYGYARAGYGLGYAGLGYNARIWKREAEAEPEADAGLYYGGYAGYNGLAGYGYGLGYAARAYAAPAYGYAARTYAAPAYGYRSAYGLGYNARIRLQVCLRIPVVNTFSSINPSPFHRTSAIKIHQALPS